MSLVDFIDERPAVFIGGRRFVVRKPTLGAVVLFERLFARDILDLYAAWRDHGPAALANAPTAFADDRDPRWIRVLPLFVAGDDQVDTWPVGELLAIALQMCDLPRIIRSLKLDELFSNPAAAAARAPLRAGLLEKFAKSRGTTLFGLMRWPYEAFLSALESERDAVAPRATTWVAATNPRGRLRPRIVTRSGQPMAEA